MTSLHTCATNKQFIICLEGSQGPSDNDGDDDDDDDDNGDDDDDDNALVFSTGGVSPLSMFMPSKVRHASDHQKCISSTMTMMMTMMTMTMVDDHQKCTSLTMMIMGDYKMY